ncbi:dTDP-4-dehydrorhamnose reductase [Caulifigura coniformis]|uniref:dTDP-4-dehydrorhamnose reductase n=1 Tax=Caulifigura coniformis TaxID=2527983 RepID=A0A517SF45_9PLAN|nr:dTDP-4-dehydrorhamnose reductase [Caulifigura coniformis]QDT54765.1 dTDP-4-dehydrorhamnose reductase [Caulifigura coniformis]
MSSHFSVALIGAGGQLATDLATALPADTRLLPHRAIELEAPASIERALEGFTGVVINTAGYNLVDQAETEPERAFAVNAFGVRNLARYCRSRNLKLVHFSTDYVLDADASNARPLDELALPAPSSVYAASKLAGEHFVRADGPEHLIIRTCGLFGIAATKAKGNFIETMLRLAQSRPAISVVDDQHCTPSFTVDVAQATVALLKAGAQGTFHITNAGHTTWRRLAAEVFRQAGLPVEVRPITSAEFGAKAKRPSWSVLDCGKLERILGRPMPGWQDAVSRYLQARPTATPVS